MQIIFTDAQIDQLADAVQARLIERKKEANRKPLSVPEFSETTGLSRRAIYRYILAGRIRCVEGMSKKLIPAAELERFQ